ncbi:uncharacterized protein [Oscarella lobularis]|uniref:uncharacterized protein isoform X2 n=1 Tax=Oscarella lobularis TaxID=121494 RepID=UPI003313737D
MDHTRIGRYSSTERQYSDYGGGGGDYYDDRRYYGSSESYPYEDDAYDVPQVPTEKLECVASLASYLLGKLALMPQHAVESATRFASNCVNWIEILTVRIGVLDRSGPGYAIWADEVRKMKHHFTTHPRPTMSAATQRNLLIVGQHILDEIRQMGKSDLTAVFHAGYLATKLILNISQTSTFEHDDGTVFLSVINDLPFERITTHFKEYLETVRDTLLQTLEGERGMPIGHTLINLLIYIAAKFDNNIKAAKSSTPSQSKATVGAKRPARKNKKQGIVHMKPGVYMIQEVSPDDMQATGKPRVIDLRPPEGKTTTEKANSSAATATAAAVSSESDSTKAAKASDLGLSEDEYSRCLEEAMTFEDRKARQQIQGKGGDSSTAMTYSDPTGGGGGGKKMQYMVFFYGAGGGARRSQSVEREERFTELPSDNESITKPPSVSKKPEKDDVEEASQKLARLEDDVKAKHDLYKERRQVYDALLADIQQLQAATKETDAEVIKNALEVEIAAKSREANDMYDELIMSEDQYVKARDDLAAETATETLHLIDDLDRETTYACLLRNLERMRDRPDKLHLMLKRHVDILASETMSELAEKLNLTATDREARVQEIRERHQITYEDDEDDEDDIVRDDEVD